MNCVQTITVLSPGSVPYIYMHLHFTPANNVNYLHIHWTLIEIILCSARCVVNCAHCGSARSDVDDVIANVAILHALQPHQMSITYCIASTIILQFQLTARIKYYGCASINSRRHVCAICQPPHPVPSYGRKPSDPCKRCIYRPARHRYTHTYTHTDIPNVYGHWARAHNYDYWWRTICAHATIKGYISCIYMYIRKRYTLAHLSVGNKLRV